MLTELRNLGLVTNEGKFPLPFISNIIDILGNTKFVYKIDLKSRHHQLQIDENDLRKTAFSTEKGLYTFLRLPPFGLRSLPAAFDRVLKYLDINNICLVYLDEIMIILG